MFRKGRLTVAGPPLGIGDVLRLKRLLPHNSMWQSKTSGAGNVYLPSDLQAHALYGALINHYCDSEISNTPYLVGDGSGPDMQTNTLEMLFNGLISFFERELGYAKTKEQEQIIAAKQKTYAGRKGAERMEIKRIILEVFGKLPGLKRPTDPVHQQELGKKCDAYFAELGRRRQFGIQANIDPDARVITFKTELLTELLALPSGRSLNLTDMALRALEKHEDFSLVEYHFACEVVAQELGTPFPNSTLTKPDPTAL
jgi:hypothetical protein